MIEISFQVLAKPWEKPFRQSRVKFDNALYAAFNALELPKRKFTVAVSMIDDEEMQEMNKEYRGKNKPTNVLSFPMIEDFSDFSHLPKDMPVELGDIILAYETIAREAVEQGKPFAEHVTHLLVHGLLHLFGYDHMNKKDAQEMEQLEIFILAKLGIADPY